MPLPMFSHQNSQPMLTHNFVVFVGVAPFSFSKVSSIEIGIETEALMEGGENQFVHTLSKPASAERTLVMERGVGTGLGGAIPSTAANMLLSVGSSFQFLLIIVMDAWGLPKKTYKVSDAILKKRSFSDLNAMNGEVLVESLEFVYKTLTEVPGVGAAFGGGASLAKMIF